ncbi:MAG: hypothetical protein LBM23_09695 [Propionibacteriaceae bacterium]|nr:hypothetical protein [Propionibacteriaceae bacterium]
MSSFADELGARLAVSARSKARATMIEAEWDLLGILHDDPIACLATPEEQDLIDEVIDAIPPECWAVDPTRAKVRDPFGEMRLALSRSDTVFDAAHQQLRQRQQSNRGSRVSRRNRSESEASARQRIESHLYGNLPVTGAQEQVSLLRWCSQDTLGYWDRAFVLFRDGWLFPAQRGLRRAAVPSRNDLLVMVQHLIETEAPRSVIAA